MLTSLGEELDEDDLDEMMKEVDMDGTYVFLDNEKQVKDTNFQIYHQQLRDLAIFGECLF